MKEKNKMADFYETVLTVLKSDERFVAEDGTFLRNAVYEAAMKMDEGLIRLLLANDERKIYNRIYLVRNEREFHIYSFEDGERFEPDYVLFLQRDKTEGFEQLQIFIEPKGTQLLEKDAWKEKFLLQLKTEAVPVTIFVDDNDYRIWGLHFFNQENRMKKFDSEFAVLIGK